MIPRLTYTLLIGLVVATIVQAAGDVPPSTPLELLPYPQDLKLQTGGIALGPPDVKLFGVP